MSFLLPHFLKEGRGKIDVYFTRVFNPVWTYPDGFSWVEMLRDESKIGLHVALTPTWNETAYLADLVLPMGHVVRTARPEQLRNPQRHVDRLSPAGPARRQGARRPAGAVHLRGQPRPGLGRGRVLDRAVLADRPRGHAGHPQALREPVSARSRRSRIDEYYRYIFERVPGLPEAAKAKGLDPLAYMRKYGAFRGAQVHLPPS